MTEKQKLAADNLGLAHAVANKFRNTGVEFEELKSLAYLGIVKAANAFDPMKGYQFSTLAIRVMNNEILMYLKNNKKHLNISMSLDEETAEGCVLGDIIPDVRGGDHFAEVEWSLNLENSWKYLNKTEREVLSVKIEHQELTQKELSKMLGISQSYISRVLASAKKKMGH